MRLDKVDFLRHKKLVPTLWCGKESLGRGETLEIPARSIQKWPWRLWLGAILAGAAASSLETLLRGAGGQQVPLSILSGVGFGLVLLFGLELLPALVSGAFLYQWALSPLSLISCVWAAGGFALPLFGAYYAYREVQRNLSGEKIQIMMAGLVLASFAAGGISAVWIFLHDILRGNDIVRDAILAESLARVLGVLGVSAFLLTVSGQYREEPLSTKTLAKSLALAGSASLIASWALHWYDGLLFYCLAAPFFIVWTYRQRLLGSLLIAFSLMGIGMWASRSEQLSVFSRGTDLQAIIHAQLFSGQLLATAYLAYVLKRIGEIRYPTLVLIAGWCVQFLVAVGLFKTEAAVNQERFDGFLRENRSRIEARFRTYTDGLQGAAALMKTIGNRLHPLDPTHWRTFVEAMELPTYYPGIRGVAMIQRVPNDQMADFLGTARKLMPDFHVRSIPDVSIRPQTEEAYVVANIEPLDVNRRALGIDLASEPMRKEAADKAAATHRPAVTKRIMLVQDAQKRAGLLFFLPVYEEGKSSGWVNVPLTTDEFFRSISYVGSKEVGFTAHFAGDEEFTLFRSFAFEELLDDKPASVQAVEIAQQSFVFRWHHLKGFVNAHDTGASWVNAAIGCLSLMLSYVFANLQLTRKKAELMAEAIAGDRDRHRSLAFHAAKMSLVGEMAGGIAHEINNPLAVIALTLQQVKRSLATQNAEDPLLVKIDKMSQTVMRITKIVQGLRTFSRSGEKLPAKSEALPAIVQGVLDLCRERFYHHSIELRVEPIPELRVIGVAVQIEQVLMNLLSNAFDATEGSEAAWVALSFQVDDKLVRIAVTDSGSGIPEAIRDKIMQPFFTTKEVGKGTGLGLSISKGIMESHHGTLSIDPECAHTRFVMSMPIADGTQATNASSQSS